MPTETTARTTAKPAGHQKAKAATARKDAPATELTCEPTATTTAATTATGAGTGTGSGAGTGTEAGTDDTDVTVGGGINVPGPDNWYKP